MVAAVLHYSTTFLSSSSQRFSQPQVPWWPLIQVCFSAPSNKASRSLPLLCLEQTHLNSVHRTTRMLGQVFSALVGFGSLVAAGTCILPVTHPRCAQHVANEIQFQRHPGTGTASSIRPALAAMGQTHSQPLGSSHKYPSSGNLHSWQRQTFWPKFSHSSSYRRSSRA